MHDTAYACGEFVLTKLCPVGGKILDVGSRDVNGTLREFKPLNAEYIGIDIEGGTNVDLVLEPGARYPFPDSSFNLVVSTSCFEHDGMFWQTIVEMSRVTAEDGIIYVSAPSNGRYHAFPHDNWRFYPDAGLALARWLRSQGQNVVLLESGTLERRGDIWNDFYAVFGKNRSTSIELISDNFPATNVYVNEVLLERTFSEDTEDARNYCKLSASHDAHVRALRALVSSYTKFSQSRSVGHLLAARFLHLFKRGTARELPWDFDPHRYLLLNPDVAAAEADAALHFATHGLKEGRPYK